MLDNTPAPFGDLTARWTGLTDDDRACQVARLLAGSCPNPHPAHVDRPTLDDGSCYAKLVDHAVDDDQVALGWLATTHRALLVTRGRVLLDRDPSEWGSLCLEVLVRTLARADRSSGRWLRRRVADHMSLQLTRTVRRHLARRTREHPAAPHVLACLPQRQTAEPDPHLDLSIAIDRSLRQLDAATRDALRALADHEPLAEVAARHHLSAAALRQRACRARRRLRPQLVGYVRGAA